MSRTAFRSTSWRSSGTPCSRRSRTPIWTASAPPWRTRAAAVTGAHESGLPYRTLGGPDTADAARPVTATAVPYFQWDNRGDGAMRVWMPLLDG
ncbi:hypothetical protein ABZY14_35245 [Streptomyces sp. NPDC006617]|uniref:hypothetical protein n=1 Tax=Streptomyces sp. NPDC006617 TaxID=3155354 RepID=UPI0033AD31FC